MKSYYKAKAVRGKVVIHIGDYYFEEPLTDDEIYKIIGQRMGVIFKKSNDTDRCFLPTTNPGQIQLNTYGIHGERKLPSTEDVKKFILSQPEFKHSMNSLLEHFLGKVVRPGDGNGSRKSYDKIWTKATRARVIIGNEVTGNWKKIVNGKGRGKPTTYLFIKPI